MGVVDKRVPFAEPFKIDASPFWLSTAKRADAIEQGLSKTCYTFLTSGQVNDRPLHEAKLALEQLSLNVVQVLILNIVRIAKRVFRGDTTSLNRLLEANDLNNRFLKKTYQILNPEVAKLQNFDQMLVTKKPKVERLVQTGFYFFHQHLLVKMRESFPDLRVKLADRDTSIDDTMAVYRSMNPTQKKILFEVGQIRCPGFNPDISTSWMQHRDGLLDVLSQVETILDSQILAYEEVVRGGSPQTVRDNDAVLDRVQSELHTEENFAVYDTSFDGLQEGISKNILDRPITVTMISAEYTGLVKQGGLAEAVEGLSQGMVAQHPDNQVQLIYPKFRHLPEAVQKRLEGPITFTSSLGEPFEVYTANLNGVKCFFIDDPAFVIEGEKPNIYGTNEGVTSTVRFARFSELAADLVYHLDTDVIHLHDWHVAAVASKLHRAHTEEWNRGEIPPVVFTFHNNMHAAQGRLEHGPYDYRKAGTSSGDNLLAKTVLLADASTTVSAQFGAEAQQLDLGEGVSFAVRQAAKVGKLTGIINGTSLGRWNPETDATLTGWTNLRTGEPLDLSYGPDSADIQGAKALSRDQLQVWVKRYMPEAKIDFSKPIVTYIGRFDSYQKGLDKFDESIEATLADGGQFICMGIGEDPEATAILDRLEAKYPEGVLFLRDYKDSNGRFHYQQGDNTRPGIGSLVRAVTDMLLVPSRFEPCGLVQFEAWLFGGLAIGANTGGLVDTIITPEEDSINFNGFRFEREGTREQSVKTVLANTLNYWNGLSNDERNALSSRLIRDGRQYGWTTSPRGFNPTEKYRFVYESARQRVMERAESSPRFNVIEAVQKRVVKSQQETRCSAEENYLRHYYLYKSDSLTLERIYNRLSNWEKSQVPLPYGHEVGFDTYKTLGAFPHKEGTAFVVHAPNAQTVSVLLFNANEEYLKEVPMHRDYKGHWRADVSEIGSGHLYQYRINNETNRIDPYGRAFAVPTNGKHPRFSVVTKSDFGWTDATWMQKRARVGIDGPMSIYEVHPGIWKKSDEGKPLNYREIAHKLAAHCKKLGHTHVELLGILEHPNEISMGYQVSGYFAPNHRLGSPEDMKYLVNYLHEQGIGVLLDFVPAHFAMEDCGLVKFDGTPQYEATGWKYKMSRRKVAFSYGSYQFDFSKKDVRDFLTSSALFWAKEMHVDGLRFDCLASMLSSEDPESAELFLRDINSVIHKEAPGVVTVAEDFTGDPRMTKKLKKGGLGFDQKWSPGWTYPLTRFFDVPLRARKKVFGLLEEALRADHSHPRVLFFSHDQVRNDEWNEGALLSRTPDLSDVEHKYANLRSILSLMHCMPGHKLLFMGEDEGNETSWETLIGQSYGIRDIERDNPQLRAGVGAMIAAFNRLNAKEPALRDFYENGSETDWILDPSKTIHAYRRKSENGQWIACYHNLVSLKPVTVEMRVPVSGTLPRVLVNTDDPTFGGQSEDPHAIEVTREGETMVYKIRIPTMATIMVKEN